MSETLLRHWALLRLIPRAPRTVSAPELHQGLQGAGFPVTLRTVQRDLNTLSAAFPLTHDEGRPPGWYWTREATSLEVPGLPPVAALTFAMAETFLAPLLPRSALASLAPQFQQARRVLDALEEAPLGDWPARVRVLPRGQPLRPPRVDPRVLEVAYEALLRGRRFQGRYQRRGLSPAQARVYQVNPLGLVVRDAVAYLVCTLWDYQDLKQLALHRFLEAQPLEQPRRVVEGFDLDAYIARGEFDLPCGPPLRLELRAARAAVLHLYETPLAEDQTCQDEAGGWVRLSATVANTRQLRWWLLGFGNDLEVLSPPALRQEIADSILKLAGRYADHETANDLTPLPAGWDAAKRNRVSQNPKVHDDKTDLSPDG